MSEQEDLTVVATVSGSKEAIVSVRRHRPDVASLDFLQPDTGGRMIPGPVASGIANDRTHAVTIVVTRDVLRLSEAM
jgi:hypothetical protein